MNRPTPPRGREPAPERDALADFVRAHREAFDAEAPPPGIWERIGAGPAEFVGRAARERSSAASSTDALDRTPAPRTPHAPRTPSARILTLYPYGRRAAVACMLLTIGVLSGLLLSERLAPRDPVADTPTAPIRELEHSYRRLLEERIAEVQLLGPDSALNAELTSFSRPDSQLSAALAGLGGANEHLVLEAMAQEYQAKLDALEHVLARLRAVETRNRGPRRNREARPRRGLPRDTPQTQSL